MISLNLKNNFVSPHVNRLHIAAKKLSINLIKMRKFVWQTSHNIIHSFVSCFCIFFKNSTCNHLRNLQKFGLLGLNINVNKEFWVGKLYHIFVSQFVLISCSFIFHPHPLFSFGEFPLKARRLWTWNQNQVI